MNRNSKACCVYWLYDVGCSTPEVSGYVGITCQLPRRLRGHTRSKRFPSFKVKILFEGTRNECSALEFNLRPDVGIGWNLGTGGRSTHGTLGKKHSDKTKKAMRDAHANRSPNEKRRLARLFSTSGKGNKSRAGQIQSSDEREKRGIALLGNKNSVGYRNSAGRVMPQEQRDMLARIRKGNKIRFGAKLTEQQKANISAGRKGKALGNKNNRNWLVTANRNADGTWKLETKE